MKIKKYVMLMGFMILTMAFLSGCRIYYNFDMSNPNAVKETVELYYSEAEMASLNRNDDQDMSKYELVTLEDGQNYYKTTDTKDATVDEINEDIDLGIIKPNLIYIPADEVKETAEAKNSIEEMYSNMIVKLTFVLSEDVIETNGTLGEDKRTVTFEYKGSFREDLYAYTSSSKAVYENDKTPPVISGLKKNKYYSYRDLNCISIKDDTALSNVTCNGIRMTRVSTTRDNVTKQYWILSNSKNYKQGKNVIVATDINGNKSTYTFLYDNVKPVVKKLKSQARRKKRVVFYVKDKDSGIKKITYNKNCSKFKKVPKKYIKKVKKGKYKGYYKVTLPCKTRSVLGFRIYDKAGNYNDIYGIMMN